MSLKGFWKSSILCFKNVKTSEDLILREKPALLCALFDE